jgi:hypothetical protein
MSYEVLPPGSVNKTGPIDHVARGYHVSWMVQLLPYLEQQRAFELFDFSVGAYDPKNAQIRRVAVPTYFCPSVPSTGRVNEGDRGDDAVTSYAACHNDVEAPIDSRNNGVFYLNSSTRYREITDGSTSTIFIGEKLPAADEFGWVSGTRDTLRNTGTPVGSYEDGAAPPPGVEMVPVAGRDRGRGTMPAGGFSSAHSGGAFFGLGDGSVRYISESISLNLYQQLGHRADGKLITEDF